MKIFARSIGSQLGNMAVDNVPEVDKIAVLKSRFADVSAFEVKLRKLNAALVSLAVSERPQQLKRLLQAKVYVEGIKKDAPQGLGPYLEALTNEIVSLREGVFSGDAQPSDLMLLSGVKTLDTVKELKASIGARIKAAEEPTGELDPAEKLILKNREFEKKVPDVTDKPFSITRVPVVFSASYTRDQSSVGHLDVKKLDSLGFKADLLDGYAVIHNQVVLGINLLEIAEHPEVRTKVPTFKKEKWEKKTVKRSGNALDVAKSVKAMLERKTKTRWEFVSEHPSKTHVKGTPWFWLMPVQDINRFAAAFPGGHVKLQSWGFAF